MTDTISVFNVDNFVDVRFEPKLRAIRLKYSRLNDEHGVNIPNAVRSAAGYATENNITNWIADSSDVKDDLSEKDAAWIASQTFRDIMIASPITTFILIPPTPETGLDNSWIPAWREATEAGFNGKISVHVAETEDALQPLLS